MIWSVQGLEFSTWNVVIVFVKVEKVLFNLVLLLHSLHKNSKIFVKIKARFKLLQDAGFNLEKAWFSQFPFTVAMANVM